MDSQDASVGPTAKLLGAFAAASTTSKVVCGPIPNGSTLVWALINCDALIKTKNVQRE